MSTTPLLYRKNVTVNKIPRTFLHGDLGGEIYYMKIYAHPYYIIKGVTEKEKAAHFCTASPKILR